MKAIPTLGARLRSWYFQRVGNRENRKFSNSRPSSIIRASKGQEEMVGFVMIVVLVTIVLVIFLGLMLRSEGGASSESTEIHQFLESSMEFTTDCAIGYIPAYARLGELLKECREGSNCIDENDACSVLNETLSGIIENGLKIGEDRPVKGYNFEAVYSRGNNVSSEEMILELSKGECLGKVLGAEYFSPVVPGIIVSKLELCY